MVADPYIGTLFNDRFLIEDRLGSGGYGVVYQAFDQERNERVALKLLRPMIATDHRIVARFRREGMVLCRLRSPHTVMVHEFAYTEGGVLYLVMELLEGKTLKHVVRHEAPIEWTRGLEILSQICIALEEAHGQGVIHRDLKPENIFLVKRPDNPEFVKILDFGIAKFLAGDGLGQEHVTQLTARGRTVGTIRYMSPEQILGRPLDARSDIYTLGVVLYRLLTARMPFPGARKPGALLAAQLANAPRPPSKLVPDREIPESVDRLILHMLQKDPKDRFRDVSDLRITCDAILEVGEWDEDKTQPAGLNLPGWLAASQRSMEVSDAVPTPDTVDETGATESVAKPPPGMPPIHPDTTDNTVDETAVTAPSPVEDPEAGDSHEDGAPEDS